MKRCCYRRELNPVPHSRNCYYCLGRGVGLDGILGPVFEDMRGPIRVAAVVAAVAAVALPIWAGFGPSAAGVGVALQSRQ